MTDTVVITAAACAAVGVVGVVDAAAVGVVVLDASKGSGLEPARQEEVTTVEAMEVEAARSPLRYQQQQQQQQQRVLMPLMLEVIPK